MCIMLQHALASQPCMWFYIAIKPIISPISMAWHCYVFLIFGILVASDDQAGFSSLIFINSLKGH